MIKVKAVKKANKWNGRVEMSGTCRGCGRMLSENNRRYVGRDTAVYEVYRKVVAFDGCQICKRINEEDV